MPELFHRLMQRSLPTAVEHIERFGGHVLEEDGEELRFVARVLGLFGDREGGPAEDPVRERVSTGGAVRAAFEEELREEGGVDER